MAEERYLGTARAPEEAADDDAATKAELQRRMEEARESITQTVGEIKDTMTTQYQNVRDTISQTLDWREQYRRRPVAFAAGALGAGLVVGYSIGGVFFGDSSELPERYYESQGDDYRQGDEDGNHGAPRAYAAQAITGGAHGSSAYAPPPPSAYPAAETGPTSHYAEASGASGASGTATPRPSYSSGYEATDAESESDKPGLFERFKETKAYDRLQQELDTLGHRAVEELSKTAQNVVLPALLGKLKDLIGLDLSTQREVTQRSRLEQQAATAQQGAGANQPAGQPGSHSSTTGGATA